MKAFKLKTGDINCLSLFISKQEAAILISNLSMQLAADATTSLAIQPIEFPINLGKKDGLFMVYVIDHELDKKSSESNSITPIDLVDTLPPKVD